MVGLRRWGVWGIIAAAVVVMLFSISPMRAQTAGQKAPAASKPVDPHDLSGVWMRENGPLLCSIQGLDKCSICDTTHTCVTGTPGVPPGGYNLLPDQVHMTAWAHDRWMAQDGGKGESGNDDPYDHCDPLNVPKLIYGYIHPFSFVQTPDKTYQMFEEAHVWRVIYTDGRPVPKKDDLPFGPTYQGSAVGHWDGNTFVVDTVGVRDDTWLDGRGHLHSEDMTTRETYRRLDHDHLELSITINDPKAYDHVFTFGPRKFDLKEGRDWEMQESYCTWGEQQRFNQSQTDPTAQGVQPPRADQK